MCNSLGPYGLQPDRLFCSWNSPGKNSGVGVPISGDLHNPGIEPRSPALQADSLLSELLRKPRNSGLGSLSLFRGYAKPRNPTRVSCIVG